MVDDEFDPRTEADAQTARALEIVVSADCSLECLRQDPGNGHHPDCKRRDYTADELETLFFALSMAMVQLVKLPGGKEARDRFYHRAVDILDQRGRTDMLDELREESARRKKAKQIVKNALGDDVDFTPGTVGYAMLKLVENGLGDESKLRTELDALAASLGG